MPWQTKISCSLSRNYTGPDERCYEQEEESREKLLCIVHGRPLLPPLLPYLRDQVESPSKERALGNTSDTWSEGVKLNPVKRRRVFPKYFNFGAVGLFVWWFCLFWAFSVSS